MDDPSGPSSRNSPVLLTTLTPYRVYDTVGAKPNKVRAKRRTAHSTPRSEAANDRRLA